MKIEIWIAFHSLIIFFFVILNVIYLLILFFQEKEKKQSLPIFVTAFNVHFSGSRKNAIYWKQSLPFFPQQLISLKTIFNLLDKKSSLFLSEHLKYFRRIMNKPNLPAAYRSFSLTFMLNNQKICGLFKTQTFSRQNQVLSGTFTNLERNENK